MLPCSPSGNTYNNTDSRNNIAAKAVFELQFWDIYHC